MYKKITLFIAAVILLSSCNYRFFVKKERVVIYEKGFLMFALDYTLFFPDKDTSLVNFLEKKKRKIGYKIRSYDQLGILEDIAAKYQISQRHRIGDQVEIRESLMRVIPVEIRSVPYHSILTKEMRQLYYIFNDKDVLLKFYDSNQAEIIYIYPLMKKDQQAFSSYYDK